MSLLWRGDGDDGKRTLLIFHQNKGFMALCEENDNETIVGPLCKSSSSCLLCSLRYSSVVVLCGGALERA